MSSVLTAIECPTPDKKRYDSYQAASFFAQTDGLRAYRCPCGKYHLSSRPGKGRMGVSQKNFNKRR